MPVVGRVRGVPKDMDRCPRCGEPVIVLRAVSQVPRTVVLEPGHADDGRWVIRGGRARELRGVDLDERIGHRGALLREHPADCVRPVGRPMPPEVRAKLQALRRRDRRRDPSRSVAVGRH